jgi:hypothetical protein
VTSSVCSLVRPLLMNESVMASPDS